MAATILESPKKNLLSRTVGAVWNPTAGSMRFLALLGVIVNAGIIFSGGAVRLTKSGLGCPTWPQCTGDSLVPTHNPEHSAVNMAIEFTNRTLTFLVLAVGVAVFVAARRMSPRRRDLVRLAMLQPLGVVAQAVWGGVTVLTKLNPATVAAHYMLSTLMIFLAFWLYVRTGEGDGPVRRLTGPRIRRLTLTLVGVVVTLLAAGTIVTGSGPHAGDDQARRFGFSIDHVAKIHALLAWAVVALTVVLIIVLHRTGADARIRRAGRLLLAAVLLQGLIGYAQYFLFAYVSENPGHDTLTAVQTNFVGVHMLGSALMWIATLHVLFSERTRPEAAATAR
ncbi:COX15/CtaA family protein [Actinocorallia longicatena]|uniref:COX15/CtaA family protein n=1 Tax=Actinocorallia longicatena TaxID=111803 RepID=A0ABP6QHV6_9ACTN